MANYLAYRIVWTSPNLPYNSSYKESKKTNDYYWSAGGEVSAGTHSAEYALPYHETVTFSAYLQGQHVSYTRVSQFKDTNYWFTKAYYYWTNVDAQIEFYEGDFTSTDPGVSDTPITSCVNDNEDIGEVHPKSITAIAKIDGQIIAKDCIGLNIMPDESDYGIYLKYSYIDSSTHEVVNVDSSLDDASINLPENSSFSKNIKVYCPPYDATPKGGNTISPGSFIYEGDDLIYDNCEITVDSSYKNGNISINFNDDEGIIYKNYSGTFTITGASNNSPLYTTKVQVDFNVDPEADFFTLNVPNEFVITYGQEVLIEAQLTTIPGLSFTCSVDNSIRQYVNDASIADGIIRIKHTERQLPDSIVGNITINVVEITKDENDQITNISEPFQSKTVSITLDKIWMPDSIVLIINQIRKRIYFEIEEYDPSMGNYKQPPYHLGEDSSIGISFSLPYTYPAQGNDIDDFTRKFRIACFGSDWRVASIDSNWIQTTLDEGYDYETRGTRYNFAVWVSPNYDITPRSGKITIISDEKQNDNVTPRTTIELVVKQHGAEYDPDFSISLCPAYECSQDGNYPVTLVDSSICSAYIYVPVSGKQYTLRVTNNCPYDILVIDSIEFEGRKSYTDNVDYTNKGYTDYYITHGYPDIDKKINTTNENLSSSLISIDKNYINGSAVTDSVWNAVKNNTWELEKYNGLTLPASKYSITNYKGSVKAVNVKIPPLGVLHVDPSDPTSEEITDPIVNKYISLKVTCHNVSKPSTTLYKSTDPRNLHQIGLTKEAAFEGYDVDPENEDNNISDLLRSFKYEGTMVIGEAVEADLRAFSVRTGYEIFSTEEDTNDVESSDAPVWNETQILDERCIVLPKDSVGYTVDSSTREITWVPISYKLD